MMQDPNVNFYETQRAFNNFWENKDIEKGKGWKQFKRWENFMELEYIQMELYKLKDYMKSI
jgi:hypothetical protein